MTKKKQKFLTTAEEDQVIAAIREAEAHTSGEIRVHIEADYKGDIEKRVKYLFKKLKMNKTERRNGVLFYMAVNNHQFYIFGDKGIYEAVPKDFWETTKDKMVTFFKEEHYTEGLIKGILEAGSQLKKYFPYELDDQNELPDEISYQ